MPSGVWASWSKNWPGWVPAIFGVALAAGTSFAASLLFAGTNVSTVLPLTFIGILFLLGRRYGFAAAVLGSILCAVIFAHCLFRPGGNWHVQDLAARRNLLWMVVGSVAVSYFFSHSASQDRSQD